MRLVIVTGMSGAGKSTVLKMLEDVEYFCVDNLPVMLIDKFVQLYLDSAQGEIQKFALGVDARSGESLSRLEIMLNMMSQWGVNYEILFLDAEDSVLIKRYKESRRNHPLAGDDRVDVGISKEREMLGFLKKRADYIIDTSQLLTRDLKQEISKIFVSNQAFKSIFVTILSFGFKYGIPGDSDLVFDVRFLPNPYYVDDLRLFSGNDDCVRDYVMESPASKVFLDKLDDMIRFLIPNYISEGKNSLVVSIGCTGGKHRSVTIANALYLRLKSGRDYGLRVEHRDVDKDARIPPFISSFDSQR